MNIEIASAKHHPATDGRPVWVMGDQVVLRAKLDGTSWNVVDVIVPPGSGTPPHSHRSPEIFRILEGRLTIWTMNDGEPHEFEAATGDLVTIPANTPHGYGNPGPTPAVIMAVLDDQMVRFFEAAASKEKPSGPPSPELIERIMRLTTEHGITVLQAA